MRPRVLSSDAAAFCLASHLMRQSLRRAKICAQFGINSKTVHAYGTGQHKRCVADRDRFEKQVSLIRAELEAALARAVALAHAVQPDDPSTPEQP